MSDDITNRLKTNAKIPWLRMSQYDNDEASNSDYHMQENMLMSNYLSANYAHIHCFHANAILNFDCKFSNYFLRVDNDTNLQIFQGQLEFL